jgi:hypothetical protein
MSDWKPINSAPRDGRHVLVTWAETWKQSGPHVELCYWAGERWHYSYDGDAPDQPPTHWQDMPAEPSR